MVQARSVRAAMAAASACSPDDIEIVIIKTTGDQVQDRPLADIGGKALWTKELDRALLAGEIDCAVHSAKDVESVRPAAIALISTPPRADVRERLIGLPALSALCPGMRVGTTSPRRAAQLLARCPGLTIVPFRGNVATRLDRIASGEADATLLASAGLQRLGIDAGSVVPVDDLLPAPGQGAIAVECRADDQRLCALLAAIGDDDTMVAVIAERSLAAALGGSCHSPVAALAVRQGDSFVLRAEILSARGDERITGHAQFAAAEAAEAGETLAGTLLSRASPGLRRMFGNSAG